MRYIDVRQRSFLFRPFPRLDRGWCAGLGVGRFPPPPFQHRRQLPPGASPAARPHIHPPGDGFKPQQTHGFVFESLELAQNSASDRPKSPEGRFRRLGFRQG